jgi:hypothetical protein
MYQVLLATAVRHENGCLIATKGSVSRGYLKVWADGTGQWVHRLVMSQILGRPLLPGRTESVDHECHNQDKTCQGDETCVHRCCIEESHLVVRDQTENWRRGRQGVQAKRRAKTHCPRNHPYEKGNLRTLKSGARACLICHRDRERRRREG